VTRSLIHQNAMADPPRELIDPDGEGIYILSDSSEYRTWPGVLMRAAMIFHGAYSEWRDVESELRYMKPLEDGETWVQASTGRFPRYWRLNLPKRWRPVLYTYCTPRP
jgi:hypothetical protein